MFDDDDPVLARVRELAFGFPGAEEKVSHGRPAFFTNEGVRLLRRLAQGRRRVGAAPHLDRRAAGPRRARSAAAGAARVRPAYLGPSGWLGVDLDEVEDWTEVGELLDASFRVTAPERLVAKLDART